MKCFFFGRLIVCLPFLVIYYFTVQCSNKFFFLHAGTIRQIDCTGFFLWGPPLAAASAVDVSVALLASPWGWKDEGSTHGSLNVDLPMGSRQRDAAPLLSEWSDPENVWQEMENGKFEKY